MRPFRKTFAQPSNPATPPKKKLFDSNGSRHAYRVQQLSFSLGRGGRLNHPKIWIQYSSQLATLEKTAIIGCSCWLWMMGWWPPFLIFVSEINRLRKAMEDQGKVWENDRDGHENATNFSYVHVSNYSHTNGHPVTNIAPESGISKLVTSQLGRTKSNSTGVMGPATIFINGGMGPL